MVQIHHLDLSAKFGDASALYEAAVNRRGFVAKPHISGFDVELIETPYATTVDGIQFAILFTLVHQERRAYPVLFSHDEIAAMRERLEALQVSMGYAGLLTAGLKDVFGHQI